jgi:hypothetical protein
MNWRTALTALLIAALGAAGCAMSNPEQKPAGQEPQPTASPVVTPPTATAPAKPDGAILTDAAGALVRTDLPTTGGPVKPEAEGLYLFDIASGRLESWTVAGAKIKGLMDGPAFRLSDDGRWVIARGKSNGYLADRTSPAIYQWDRSQFELVAASAQALVFEKTTAGGDPRWYQDGWGTGGHTAHTGSFQILSANLASKATFTLPAGGEQPRPALFSPDGTQLALLAGTTLHLVDVASGKATPVAEGVGADRLTPVSNGFLAEPPPVVGANAIHRVDWSGKVTKSMAVGKVSPDGALTLKSEFVGGLTPAVQVVDSATNTVQYRILAADTCYVSGGSAVRWTADSAAFTVRTREGFQLVSTNGRLRPLAFTAHPQGHHGPTPAPHDANLFLDSVYLDGADYYHILTAAGERQASIVFEHVGGMEHAARVPLWHPSGKWIQLSLYMRGGHDGPCGDYSIPLAPKVEKPPFADDLKLQVQNTGDCLNVRAEADLNSSRLGCYKDGTVLPLVRSGHGWLDAQTWSETGQWVRVKTPDGQVGWASLKDGYLTWAD